MRVIILALLLCIGKKMDCQQPPTEIVKTFIDTVLIFDHPNYYEGQVFALDFYSCTNAERQALSTARKQSDFELENSIENLNWVGRFYYSGQANTDGFIGYTDFNLNINGKDYPLSAPLTVINTPRAPSDAASSLNIYISAGKKQLIPGAYSFKANLITSDSRNIIHQLNNQNTSIPNSFENQASAILIPSSEMRNMEWARADTEKITLPQILILLN